MAEETFTVTFNANLEVIKVEPPPGARLIDSGVGLAEKPETVTSIVVPLEILRTVNGMTCVHSGCRKYCW
jgi:hypothetical protein